MSCMQDASLQERYDLESRLPKPIVLKRRGAWRVAWGVALEAFFETFEEAIRFANVRGWKGFDRV